MTDNLIKSYSLKYIVYSIITALITAVVAYGLATLLEVKEYCTAIIVGFGYFIVMSSLCAIAWQWMIRCHKDQMPNYHIAVSVVRMLTALLTVAVVALKSESDSVAPFIVTFMGFYAVMLGYHTLFFSKINSLLEK